MPETNDEGSPDLESGLPRRRGRTASAGAVAIRSGREAVSVELALTIFRQMVRTRALEERAIKMSKSGEAYFWIGGPGEEAVNVCLGMQVRRGSGPAHDYLHLHYRSAGTLLRELWGEGQRLTADELLREVTGAAVEMESVADRIREVLRGV